MKLSYLKLALMTAFVAALITLASRTFGQQTPVCPNNQPR